MPIRVAQSNAYVAFDEVALVEPGEPGTVFGDFAFWDYVIVEGTTDGVNWIPVADGWDARAYPEWQSAYFSGTTPTTSLLRRRTLDLHDHFQWGDTVLLRFRLYADGAANGWG